MLHRRILTSLTVILVWVPVLVQRHVEIVG